MCLIAWYVLFLKVPHPEFDYSPAKELIASKQDFWT